MRGKFWRPVRELNPCYRREREATYCNSTELSGMDSTLPHLKDSRERLLDSQWTLTFGVSGCASSVIYVPGTTFGFSTFDLSMPVQNIPNSRNRSGSRGL